MNKQNRMTVSIKKLPADIQTECDGRCRFCNYTGKPILNENEYAFTIEDAYPVSLYHSLIIPKRHFSDFFMISELELSAVYNLLTDRKNYINKVDPDVTGYNIGINAGVSAGQTVSHCHIHLIPRRNGDVEDPKGGVRGVIPNKKNYPYTLISSIKNSF